MLEKGPEVEETIESINRDSQFRFRFLTILANRKKIDFFTISILENWVKIVDFSISIKIDPALVFIECEKAILKWTRRRNQYFILCTEKYVI